MTNKQKEKLKQVWNTLTDKERAEYILWQNDCYTYEGNFIRADKVLDLVSQGLAEGKPKWHDIRKNPNDLPEHSGLYCVQCGEVREYIKEEKSWFTVHFEPCMNCTEDTYLWCELPKFEE